MNAWEFLAKIDREMTMMDVDLMEWQGHLDMAALACLDLTVYETEVQMELPLPLNVKRVPLRKGLNGPVIGVADVDMSTGLMKAEIDDEYKELIGFPDAFSIRDDDPPKWDHDEIKAQLRDLVKPAMYENKYVAGKFDWEKYLEDLPKRSEIKLDEMSVADLILPKVSLKMKVAGTWTDLADIPDEVLDNHPFFKEEQ